MKLETFCKLTGWPYEEFMDLYVSEVIHILSLYGYVLKLRRRKL